MIKNLVFDFGGVIVDIDRDKAVQAFIKIGLLDADTRLDKYHQTGIFQDLEEGKLTADEFRKELGLLCGRELSYDETRQAWLGFVSNVNLDKLDYVMELRKSYRVDILSNTNPFVMSWACSTDFSPKQIPLYNYCDKMYLSYQMGHTKPAREIFDQMLADSGLLPSETLFIDDGASNVKIGQELGFQTFQPINGADWREELNAILKR
ncbi:HAD family hydrolase [Bacteroides reticulotermitis]|uniref:Haloacid dehalogenase-like hydrolase n=2 Tax=Bacteroides reticulotermitis TaxID=1133319 RepID=W4US04_9BACE|nr:HAD family phosphatase [Bacteroides reticulotermitis]MBB4043778.1 putative hydrolase of the HAD superfamily [Bacteroides reticulotermitis]GAE83299.1 haloacid dehalogenase-like hydrolase [Bacteroides reticulotermitis JCM 10512]